MKYAAYKYDTSRDGRRTRSIKGYDGVVTSAGETVGKEIVSPPKIELTLLSFTRSGDFMRCESIGIFIWLVSQGQAFISSYYDYLIIMWNSFALSFFQFRQNGTILSQTWLLNHFHTWSFSNTTSGLLSGIKRRLSACLINEMKWAGIPPPFIVIN